MKTHHRKTLATALLAAATLGAPGCAETNTIDSAATAETRGAITKEDYKHFRGDLWFGTQAVPQSLHRTLAEDGVSLKVQLLVKNEKWFGRTLRFNYKVLWFDANGIALTGYDPPIRSLFINAGETVPIVAVAPRPTAKDFQFVFIEEM